MQILLSWGDDCTDDFNGTDATRTGRRKADLLARDGSFGDGRTPLHKAAAGGRPLAVKLLTDALRRRRLLREALRTRDAGGETPLAVARRIASLDDEEVEAERQSVQRWEVSASGVVNWDA